MPTWRKLHQKATESLDLNELPDDFTRLLWLLLPLGLDREGRGLDNPSWVKAKLMPLRTDVSLDQVAVALDCFAARGMIQRYQVNGRSYFVIPTWHKYQGDTSREAGPFFPPPPDFSAAPPDFSAAAPAPEAPALDDTSAPASQDQITSESSVIHDLLTSDSQVTHDFLVSNSCLDSDSDSDSEEDLGSDLDSDSPDPPAKNAPPAQTGEAAGTGVSEDADPLLLFRQSYDLSRLTLAQERTLHTLTAVYGAQLLSEVIAWAVHAGIPQSRALRAISSALPGWRSPATPGRSHRRRDSRNAAPSTLDPLDELIAEIKQQEEQETDHDRPRRNRYTPEDPR